VLQILPGREAAFLAPLPIGRLLGVGPKTEADLKTWGIATIGALAGLPQKELERIFGEQAGPWRDWSRGVDDSPVAARERAKSIGREETFLIDRSDPGELREVLQDLTCDVAYRLRSEGLVARTVCLKVRYPDFSLHTHSKTLSRPTCWDRDLFSAASGLLEKALARRASLRLLGVSVQNLSEAVVQMDLLEAGRNERLGNLHTAADRLRERYGYDSVAWASLRRKK
jgi:DNA polymerase-4